jgi:hypothetical protein
VRLPACTDSEIIFTTACLLALGSIQRVIRCIPRALSSAVKRTKLEAAHLHLHPLSMVTSHGAILTSPMSSHTSRSSPGGRLLVSFLKTVTTCSYRFVTGLGFASYSRCMIAIFKGSLPRCAMLYGHVVSCSQGHAPPIATDKVACSPDTTAMQCSAPLNAKVNRARSLRCTHRDCCG